MAFFLRALRLGRKNRSDTSPQSPPTPPLPSSLSYPSMMAKRNPHLSSDMENMEKKRWDSLESWSMLLEPGSASEGGAAAGAEEEGEEWMADLSQLFLGNKFASGSHSRIYRGIYKQRAVAVKMVRIPDQDEDTRALLEKQFKSEVSVLSRFYHPNIVQFIAACKKPPVYCIITEYMSQGTLRMYLHKKEPYSLSTETILRLALDISRGMQYLHSQGVIHRDLKSDNLLLNDEMRVKVSDFGTSCLETQTRASKGMTPVQAAYAACEKNLRPPLSENCSPVLNNLIKNCWSANPVKRPDFNYIVAVLEKYDECLKDGVPLFSHNELRNRISLKRFKGCISTCSSIPVQA